jgi:hypothetical protein
MSCHAIEQVDVSGPSLFARMSEVLFFLVRRRSEALPTLDLDEMPEGMKRDLGFLDGQEPYYEDDCRRR